MKLKDIKQKYGESFEVQVKPKQFSYKDLYEELSQYMGDNENISEEQIKDYIFWTCDIIAGPEDLIVKL